MRKTKRWTTNEIDHIKSLVEFHTNAEIADMYSTTKMTIKRLLDRYNIKRTKETKHKMLSNGAIKRNKEAVGPKNPAWKSGISQNNYKYKLTQMKRFPDRVQARKDVYQAIKSGKLTPQPCELCGSNENIEGHHNDYSKPLDVKWVCRSCHRNIIHKSEVA